MVRVHRRKPCGYGRTENNVDDGIQMDRLNRWVGFAMRKLNPKENSNNN